MTATTSYGIYLLDNRIAQRNIKQGRLEKSVYEEFMTSLPDLSEACENISSEIYSLDKSKVALSGEFVSGEEDNE